MGYGEEAGMKPIQKPPWLIYAAQAREELSKVRMTKSGRYYDAHILSTWKTAWQEHGYEGSERDWDYLVHNYDKVNRIKQPGKKI